MIPYRKKPSFNSASECPHVGRERLTMPQLFDNFDTEGWHQPERALPKQMYESGRMLLIRPAGLADIPEIEIMVTDFVRGYPAEGHPRSS